MAGFFRSIFGNSSQRFGFLNRLFYHTALYQAEENLPISILIYAEKSF